MTTEDEPGGGDTFTSTGIRTFMKLRHTREETELAGCDFAVVGLPFDTSASFGSGAGFAPSAIREVSTLIRPHHPVLGVAPFELMRGVDYGDSEIVRGNAGRSIEVMAETISRLVTLEVMPICMGGDHTVSLPVLRALAERHGPVGLIHFDSHTDTARDAFGEPYGHSTPFQRAWEEGWIAGERSVQLGIRGSLGEPARLERTREQGFTIITGPALLDMGPEEVGQCVCDVVGVGPVYLSFDIDFLDPAFAPGTGTPEVGGPSTSATLEYIRALDLSGLVGADLVEVLPALDPAQVTAYTAACIMFEILSVYSASL